MIGHERRSGIDTRLESQKQSVGERRSGIDRRTGREPVKPMPTDEQLMLFARRLRRTMRDEKGRAFLGVAVGEEDFAFYPEVIRLVEWIEDLTGAESTPPSALSHQSGLRKNVP
jgi:phosphoenolpyruvate carboxylase